MLDQLDKLRGQSTRSAFSVNSLKFYIEQLTDSTTSLRTSLPDPKILRKHLLDIKDGEVTEYVEQLTRLLRIATTIQNFKKDIVKVEEL